MNPRIDNFTIFQLIEIFLLSIICSPCSRYRYEETVTNNFLTLFHCVSTNMVSNIPYFQHFYSIYLAFLTMAAMSDHGKFSFPERDRSARTIQFLILTLKHIYFHNLESETSLIVIQNGPCLQMARQYRVSNQVEQVEG